MGDIEFYVSGLRWVFEWDEWWYGFDGIGTLMSISILEGRGVWDEHKISLPVIMVFM